MPEKLFVKLSDNKTPPTYKFFNGEVWVESLSGKTTDVVSPIDSSIVGRIQVVTPAEIDQAIMRAKKAQKDWQDVPMVDRAKILHLAADWIREYKHPLTTLLVREIGKPVKAAQDEILRSSDMIDYFANDALNMRGEEISADRFPGEDKTKMAIVERVPQGVILAIAPFNYPVNLSVSKIAPAIVTGNAVIFKPPTQGSISSLLLTEIFYKAGLPKGVLATVTGGGGEIGDYLATHKGIDMVTFTGSSRVGRAIAQKSGMIPLLFECGGNNPLIVLSDCDMEETAVQIVKGAFSYSGQRCTAVKYVLGLPPTIDKLLPKVVKKTKELIKMGDPRVEEYNLGPVISNQAAEEIETRILLAKADGARIVSGGKRKERYIEPTILTNARPSMKIVNSETFGPVVSFIKVKSIDEAVKIVNDSEYGLQASIFTSDEGAGIKLAQQINVGTVQINSNPQRGPDHFPFLGVKGSGIGVQGIRYSLEAMTRPKSIVLNKPH